MMKLTRMSIGTHPEKTSQPKARIAEGDDQGIVSATVDDVCCLIMTSLSISQNIFRFVKETKYVITVNSSNRKTSLVCSASIYVYFITLYLCQDEENVEVASVDVKSSSSEMVWNLHHLEFPLMFLG